MVDFKKLRSSKSKPVATNPIEIFRRLPPPPGFFDLSPAQKEVLETWYDRRSERDLVIKLPTGGGKTLLGLLIAQSILNETHDPVVYLSPTLQLVSQTLGKANEYSIPAVVYEKGEDYFPGDFLAGRSVLICTYQALFNGLSRFGAPGSKREILNVGGLILDDAHVAFSTVRDQFTLEVERSQDEEAYTTLTNMFREDFRQLGKLGTFDDVVSGVDYNILEVAYWSWQARSTPVREYLRKKSEDYLFVWPLLRDSFDYCHALISKDAFVITPICPLVDLIPTFASCPRRIFMSATIRDDSEIIRTFDASKESISKPIVSNSLAGISERMILAPELMQLDIKDIPQMLQKIAEWAAQNVGTVILVPSRFAATSWQKVATFAESSDKVEEYVKSLQEGRSRGPFVFAHRYDGIDLPDEACRLLIISGLPRGASEYEQHRHNTLLGGAALNSALAQRLEQGMGRAARGPGDYCVVIVTGKDLIRWIGHPSNMSFLTSSTRAQLQMGIEISKNVDDIKGLAETIDFCFGRDKDWIEYHAETLAESIELEQINVSALEYASVERKAFRLWRDGYLEKAVAKLDKHCQSVEDLDSQSKGWLLQFAARIAHYWGRKDKAQEFQQHAYASNRQLMRPEVTPPYVRLVQPGRQAEAIVKEIDQFFPRRGFLAEFDEVVSHLVPEASSNLFEESLRTLGLMLGFAAERPEETYNNGPDVLWLLSDDLGLVIEAKSRKKEKNALTKDQHGQLLVSIQWFQQTYPDYRYIPLSVQPSNRATKNAAAENSKVLTYTKLNELIADSRQLFAKLVESIASSDELAIQCEQLLHSTKLRPEKLTQYYLESFVVENER